MNFSQRDLRQVNVVAEETDSDPEKIVQNGIERFVEEGSFYFFFEEPGRVFVFAD